MRTSTSRANTTAAAGAPPITEACAPSSASVSSPSLSAREKTTKAPPWKREMTQNTIGPAKFTIGAADLGAVLELQPPHRLGRAVEAGEVGEHDERPPARRGVDGARDLLRREREQRAGAPAAGPVGRDRAEARQRARLDADHRHGPAAEGRVPHHGRLGLAHRRPALERLVVGVGHRAHHRADVERLLAARGSSPGRRSRRRSRGRSRAPRAARRRRRGPSGSSVCARRGKRSPGAT